MFEKKMVFTTFQFVLVLAFYAKFSEAPNPSEGECSNTFPNGGLGLIAKLNERLDRFEEKLTSCNCRVSGEEDMVTGFLNARKTTAMEAPTAEPGRMYEKFENQTCNGVPVGIGYSNMFQPCVSIKAYKKKCDDDPNCIAFTEKAGLCSLFITCNLQTQIDTDTYMAVP